MDKEAKSLNQLNFIYKFPEDYNPKYVNGAYGGISPSGEIVANFYLERIPIPYKVVQEIKKDGSLGDEVGTEPESHGRNLIRFVETGVVFDLRHAKEFHLWLGTKISELEQITEKGIK
jgi:hypothetical protein